MSLPIVDAVKLAIFAYFLFRVTRTIYNVYFHPLSRFPGSKVWIAFPVLRHIASIRGVLDTAMCELHEKHGPVVRFGPDEVSFITEEAWRDIYDHKPNQLQRAILPVAKRPDVFDADEEDHDRYRKAMSYSFSPKGLQQQEPIVKGYIDLLIQRLREETAKSGKVDMVMWYTLTLFDVIGDLAFGQSFDGLRNSVMHFTISFTFEAFKLLTFLEAGAVYPVLFKILELFTPKELIEARDRKEAHAEETVRKRLNDPALQGRADFMESMLKNRGKANGLNDAELIANASTLITAGSETTSTILAGLTWWLLKTPEAYKKCVEEVRSAYQSEDDILMSTTVNRLPYLNACFSEGFRLYPPVPSGLQRVCPAGETTKVSGYDMPPNVSSHSLIILPETSIVTLLLLSPSPFPSLVLVIS